ncbi:MAG: hypothetical protein K2Y35_05215 [Burkholderiales bacterium]|nr:hypothetical protein [Burkholderiales bacterium]
MTTRRLLRIATVVLATFAFTACDRAPNVPFAPYGEGYAARPDFARVEHDFPLTPADLEKITPKNIAKLTQEQVDQIYARLPAGPIPDGAFDGTLFFPKGVSGDRRLSEIVGGLGGLIVELKGAKLELIGKTLWKGKVFYRDERVLRNRIEDLSILKPIIDDPDSLRKISVDGRDAWLLFPAKLYCGQSLLDSRRESIIIDYAFTDEIEGYKERPDFLAGRRGLRIRDEIRMVRPGFYLGRAYADRAFLLNFTLYNPAMAERDGPAFLKTGQTSEDCWSSTSRVVAAAK